LNFLLSIHWGAITFPERIFMRFVL
jgi:hypothetical protein